MVTVKAETEGQGCAAEVSLLTWVRNAVGWKHYNMHIKGSLRDFTAWKVQRMGTRADQRVKLTNLWRTDDACSLSEGIWQKQTPFGGSINHSMFLLLFSCHFKYSYLLHVCVPVVRGQCVSVVLFTSITHVKPSTAGFTASAVTHWAI